MKELRFLTTSPEATRRLGARLGQAARPGDVFLLEGPFGAGKTVFVQGLAEGLGVPTPVASPSFIIMAEHRGRLPLYHVDLYRVEHLDETVQGTLEDYLADQGVTAIEWSERLPPDLRQGATLVSLSPAGDERRAIIIRTPSDRLARAAEAARQTVEGVRADAAGQ